jgi:hypothetical protein
MLLPWIHDFNNFKTGFRPKITAGMTNCESIKTLQQISNSPIRLGHVISHFTDLFVFFVRFVDNCFSWVDRC